MSVVQQKTTKSSWSSQFGLYRYRSPEIVKDNSNKNKRTKSNLIVAIFTMLSILLLVVWLMINGSSSDVMVTLKHDLYELEEFNNTEESPKVESPITTTEVITNVPEIFENQTEYQLVDGENHFLNETVIEAPEKLLGNPRTYLLPPPPTFYRQENRRLMTVDPKLINPRPFNYDIRGPIPSAFQKTNRTHGSVNNIQDIISHLVGNSSTKIDQQQQSTTHHNTRYKFSGVYSHPRLKKYEVFDRNQGQIYNNDNSYSYNRNYQHDPFYAFKPGSPSDVNLLAVNKFRFAPQYYGNRLPVVKKPPQNNQYSPVYSKPLLYPELYNLNSPTSGSHFSERDKMHQNAAGATEDKRKNKPFSLMLDIYPMIHEDEEEPAPSPKPKSKKPKRPHNGGQMINPLLHYPQYYNAPQQIPENYYFHNLNQPYLQNQYQNEYYNNYYRNRYFQNNEFVNYGKPYYVNKDGDSKIVKDFHSVADGLDKDKPSQMIVHLNLYPKKKIVKTKHRAIEILNRNIDLEDEEKIEATTDQDQEESNDYNQREDLKGRRIEENIKSGDFTTAVAEIDEEPTSEADVTISKASEVPVIILTEKEFNELTKNYTNLNKHTIDTQ